MKAKIVNFRLGRHTKYDNQMILKIEDVDSKEKTKDLIGKVVVWKTPSGKEIKGKVAGSHGNNGRVRVIFEKGMPGQSINKEVVIS